MEGKTKEYPRRLIPPGIPGKFLMADKILDVPGTGRAGNPQPSPFLFRLGNLFQEIRQVTMGIRSHGPSLKWGCPGAGINGFFRFSIPETTLSLYVIRLFPQEGLL